MLRTRLLIARDYNRGLAAPVRAAHVVCAVGGVLLAPIRTWVLDARRRDWALPVVLGALATLAVYPLDGPVSHAAAAIRESGAIGGDVRRELEAWGQYGAVGSIAVVAFIVYRLDPARRRRLLDLAAALLVAFIVVSAGKYLVGRPRPKFDDPAIFPGPLGAYPLGGGRGVAHGWEVWRAGTYDLASMPSSHAAYAAVLSVFLGVLYPRIRGLAWILAGVVGVGRIALGAHYPTDVVTGLAAGAAVARCATCRRWGERAAGALLGRKGE
jgi:membrane-associated phospholipid phosphatase